MIVSFFKIIASGKTKIVANKNIKNCDIPHSRKLGTFTIVAIFVTVAT